MSAGRKLTEKEIEALFFQQWEKAIGRGRSGAVKGFLRLKNWVGPRLWSTLTDMEFTQDEWYLILNVLPRGMSMKKTSTDFIADMLVTGMNHHSDFSDLPQRQELQTEVVKPKPMVVGNLVRLQFGKNDRGE
jgi:hypothetical protein